MAAPSTPISGMLPGRADLNDHLYDTSMAFVIVGIVIVALIFGPGLWVRRVLSRYSVPPDRYKGTGAQLA